MKNERQGGLVRSSITLPVAQENRTDLPMSVVYGKSGARPEVTLERTFGRAEGRLVLWENIAGGGSGSGRSQAARQGDSYRSYADGLTSQRVGRRKLARRGKQLRM